MSKWHGLLSKMRPQFLQRCKGLLLSQRSMASKEHDPSPMCSKGGAKKNACEKLPCSQKSLDEIPKLQKDDEFQFYHLLVMPPACCADPCPDRGFPKFDECLYKSSDKAKRKYQVTWVECPPIKIKPKKICCFDTGKRPPIVRRKRKAVAAECADEVSCPTQGACPKFAMPGCRPVRIPARCARTRTPTDCVKVKAPYPAFSECSRSKPCPRRKVECQCLSIPSLCDVLSYRKRTEGIGRRSNCGSKK